MDNEFTLKKIRDLNGGVFVVPEYQRGYRWGVAQVEDLLNDLWEYFTKNCVTACYCLNPLVVKKCADSNVFEVIDGQQRLTTIFIILKYLKNEPDIYELRYLTRTEADFTYVNTSGEVCRGLGCENFLKHINEVLNSATENIDFFHIRRTYLTIQQWFKNRFATNKKQVALSIDKFREMLLNQVFFVWCEASDENPIEIFSRLNSGKIVLSNGELIKALLLKQSKFSVMSTDTDNKLRNTIATQWNEIEYSLQNDEFWFFINNLEAEFPVRIEFIFELILKSHVGGVSDNGENFVDNYRLFRYINDCLDQFGKDWAQSVNELWNQVREVFAILTEWYHDVEFFHYVGFLVHEGYDIARLLKHWKKSKDDFRNYLINEIKKVLGSSKDLSRVYNGGKSKMKCEPLLLLFNLQTIVDENKGFFQNYQCNSEMFYKFPFHLYKLENWDIEHIYPNTTNNLTRKNHQDEWIKDTCFDLQQNGIILGQNFLKQIADFLNENGELDFDTINDKLMRYGNDAFYEIVQQNSEWDKNQIWNFTLLDSNTNRGYGNAFFATKRRRIRNRELGIKSQIEMVIENGEYIFKETTRRIGKGAFVPPCTRNVFMKYYTALSTDLRTWTQTDAEAYRARIAAVLGEKFGVVIKGK